MITIAVDAMGGDNAPRPEVEGSVLAAREYGVRILLVGQPQVVRAELAKHAAPNLPIEIVPASEVITMTDHPAQAFRRKKDSSVHVAARLVRETKADGLVSAGNTGAIMTVARYYRATFGHRRPRVGLLSIGEEEMKGNELTREVYTRLKRSPVHFVGNVEGGDLFSGEVDVIVCDGFVGNIALKICEGLAFQIFGLLRKSINSSLASQVGFLFSRGALKGLKKKIDYAESGGAPLLGVRGVCVIAHGRSNANAIKNAIRVASGLAKARINEKIEEELSVAGVTA